MSILGNPRSIDAARAPEEMYLDLLKRALTRALIAGPPERHTFRPTRSLFRAVHPLLKKTLAAWNLELVRVRPHNPDAYLESGHEAQNRIEDAETMVGLRQLDSLHACIADVIKNNISGDFLEAGVWRGGVTIFMRGALKAYGDAVRRIWVADSFSGLPRPDPRVESFDWNTGDMAVSLDQVKRNFERYGLLDERVRFLPGFFEDTLPGSVGALSILRLDADLYQSTKVALEALYPKLSVGGYAIFDDYQNLSDCRRAVDEYREGHGILDEIIKVDRRAIYWRRTP
jgi:O-methyltransferase